jgi:hypothetical protein
MPPSNMDRKHNKREMERAKGNIAWTVQHIQIVYQAFYDTALYLAEQEQEVPDSYIETMNALTEITAALVQIGQVIEQVNDTI